VQAALFSRLVRSPRSNSGAWLQPLVELAGRIMPGPPGSAEPTDSTEARFLSVKMRPSLRNFSIVTLIPDVTC
jgi:hypothetical protein